MHGGNGVHDEHHVIRHMINVGAGVSNGTLFLYFSSKEELFKAVVRSSISDRLAR